MKEEPEQKLRKTLLVEPHFQLSFIAYTIVVALVVTVVVHFSDSYFFWSFVQKGKQLGLSENHIFFQFLREQQKQKNMIFLASGFIILVFLSVYGLYVSNKVAGPIEKLRAHLLKIMQSNKLEEIHFRKRDYFNGLAQTFNQFIKTQTGK